MAWAVSAMMNPLLAVAFPHPAGRFPAVELGEAHVHQDEVIVVGERHLDTLQPVDRHLTSKPLRWRRRDSMSRFISLSSTSRIFGIAISPRYAGRHRS
jgi:hypothetical protein